MMIYNLILYNIQCISWKKIKRELLQFSNELALPVYVFRANEKKNIIVHLFSEPFRRGR